MVACMQGPIRIPERAAVDPKVRELQKIVEEQSQLIQQLSKTRNINMDMHLNMHMHMHMHMDMDMCMCMSIHMSIHTWPHGRW